MSGSKFPCDSRGGLRLAVSCQIMGLLDRNVRHTIEKSSFLIDSMPQVLRHKSHYPTIYAKRIPPRESEGNLEPDNTG